MELGYSFHWPAYSAPTLTYPSGRKVTPRVDNYTPIIDADFYTLSPEQQLDTVCALVAPAAADSVPCASDASRVAGAESPPVPLVWYGLPAPVAPAEDVPEPAAPEAPADVVADPAPPDPEDQSLRDRALSLQHLMTHYPKNPYCPSCARARLRHAPTGRGHAGWRVVQAKRFGDVITCDHIIEKRGDSDPGGDRRTAMSVYDVGTRFLACYPLPTKSAEHAERALRHFLGPQCVSVIHSDGSEELKAAVRALGVLHDTSTPYVHQRSAQLERQNETTIGGARTLRACRVSRVLLAVSVSILLSCVQHRCSRRG